MCGTIVAAGVVGTMSLGLVDHAAPPAAVTVATVTPLQPPPPPPGWPPPALHQPGQQGPAPGEQDRPPSPQPPADEPICQDIMGVPDVNAPCHDPSTVA